MLASKQSSSAVCLMYEILSISSMNDYRSILKCKKEKKWSYDTQMHILPISRNAFNFISIKVSVKPQNLVLGRQFRFYGLIQISIMKNALKGKFSAMGFFLPHLDPQLYAL